MTDAHPRLARYVDAWRDTADRVLALGRELGAEDWARPTDLTGWTVGNVYAHLAAVETELAGGAPPQIDLPAGLEHVRDEFGRYTERGIRALADREPAALLDLLREAVGHRQAAFEAEPPVDPSAPAPVTPGGMPWTWETLLRNRVIDLWMHEQDIRRAVGRPGGLDSPGAAVTVRSFAGSLPYVLGKKVAPPAGTTVVWAVTGPQALVTAVRMGEDGRAAAVEQVPGRVDARLEMGTEEFAILSGGRRPVAEVPVSTSGDAELVQRVLAAMAVTP